MINRRLFQNVSVQDPRNNTYHYMVLGCLFASNRKEHQLYLGWRTWIPIFPPRVPTRGGVIFEELRGAIPKIRRKDQQQAPWITADMWRSMDTQVTLCRSQTRYQTSIRTLRRRIQALLNVDIQWHSAEAGAAVKSLLVSGLSPVKEAWHWMWV